MGGYLSFGSIVGCDYYSPRECRSEISLFEVSWRGSSVGEKAGRALV